MTDWAQTALLFPGQGSQEVGMGRAVAAAYPVARAVFEAADDLLGIALSRLCWEGPAEALDDTINTQPALYVTSIATLRALEDELGASIGDAIRPAFVAGHSLGELTALTAAGALPFEDGVKLVRERGRVMKAAGEAQPGAIAAVLGLDAAQVQVICEQASAETGRPLVIANDNCPGQLVISGDETALERGLTLAAAAGAKRALRLAVSVAVHSPLMQSAVEPFRAALAAAVFHAPRVPVLGNVQAIPLTPSPDALRAELAAQLTASVRWTESIQAMEAAGVTRYIEVGSKDVLVGLVKRISRQAERIALNDAAGLQGFVQSL